MVIPSQKSENHEPPLNANRGNQVCVRRLNFGQAFRKTLLEYILRRGTGFLLGGGLPWIALLLQDGYLPVVGVLLENVTNR